MPTVLINADGCTVVDLTSRLCKRHGMPVLILCAWSEKWPRRWCSIKVPTVWISPWSAG